MAVLGRRALETGVDDFWRATVPSMAQLRVKRTKFVCLRAYLDPQVAGPPEELLRHVRPRHDDLGPVDPRAALRQIAAVLGERAQAAIATADGLEAILRETSIEAMRRDQRRWSSERPAWATGFVRSGAVGDWQSLFTAEQAGRLLAEFDRRLNGTALAGLWPDVLAAARDHARPAAG